MKLSMKALAVAIGLLWGGALLAAGILNAVWPPYGAGFLSAISSMYPGFHASRTFGDVLVGTAYGFVDGAVCGWLLAWLYNVFAGRSGGNAR